MGLDDIERLLRKPDDRMLTPVEVACVDALLTSHALSDVEAEALLAALTAEDHDAERTQPALTSAQLDAVASALTAMSVEDDGPRRALAERLGPRLSATR